MGPEASLASRADRSARRRPSDSSARRRARASAQGLPAPGSSDRLGSADDLARDAEEVSLVGLPEVRELQIYRVPDPDAVSPDRPDPIVPGGPRKRDLQLPPPPPPATAA